MVMRGSSSVVDMVHNNNDSSSSKKKTVVCVVDTAVLNADTLPQMTDIGLSFFAELCGRNRGVFVVRADEKMGGDLGGDGHTYGCTQFPHDFAQRAGVVATSILDQHNNNTTVLLKDANAIKDAYTMGNVTASDTVKLLDYLVQTTYQTSGQDVQESDVYACSVGGLAHLQCPPAPCSPSLPTTIRSVTLVGLFNIATPWATPGKLTLSEHEARRFYTASDLDEMKTLGLNTVQLVVPLDAFSPNTPPGAYYPSSSRASRGGLIVHHLTQVLDLVQAAGLQAIVVLVGAENDDAVAAAATYAVSLKHASVVFGLTLPSQQSWMARSDQRRRWRA
jgi:hypothetical protein